MIASANPAAVGCMEPVECRCMGLSTSSLPGSATYPRLSVRADRGPAGQDLLAFELAASGWGRAALGTGLVWLGGDLAGEHWQVPSLLETGALDGGWWARDRDLMAVVLTEADGIEQDPDPLACRLYKQLLDHLRSAGYPELLRSWNYMPGINHGSGDDERYRRFCTGRGRALTEAGLDDAEMCAATAIGSQEPRFRLIVLAGRRPGVALENPRQVSAWDYPRRYGPRSPAFARATALPLADDGIAVLVSGTASVVGHATAHPGDVLAQTDEAATNVEVLLNTAAERFARPGAGQPDGGSRVRVYVRQAADWSLVEQRLRQRWPGARLAGLRGDICRRDLLVEIEAWHVLGPSGSAGAFTRFGQPDSHSNSRSK
ncbi:pteridine-dependent deoxygenase [Wenzhouxiangella sp. AB-CW3]|uniref:chorismate transformation enzyme, FkbO/Hyg5 family n=1 Tax=Wenzhouxiangella sp. AB-CW3 TaxID=2771012 RepID=UPI00168A8FC5|nr:pteridine-dependent deoxygenase [Wenzhouxiangella sp. AB-CW3]QOC22545.1 pteridine-dependent deoxygenase [Wenzhouxiangella sp. AB-CW3]